jgi:hypothetical protein
VNRPPFIGRPIFFVREPARVRLNKKLDQYIAGRLLFDPCVGLQTRYHFNKIFYTAVRGEIEGYGVGADLT